MSELEHTNARLPDDILALLTDSSIASAPADVRERVLTQVNATIAQTGQGGAPEAAAEAAAEVAVASGQGIGAAVAILTVVLVVGGLLRPGQGPPVSEVVPGVTLLESKDAPTVRNVRPSATRMKAAPRPRTVTSPFIVSPATPKAPPVVREAPPAAEQGPAPVTVKPKAQRVPARDLAAERKLLDRARAALASKDRAGALKIVRGHRSRYPRGALVEERESLWARALLESGDQGRGVKRAERFLKRFPRSIHRGAVERSLQRARR